MRPVERRMARSCACTPRFSNVSLMMRRSSSDKCDATKVMATACCVTPATSEILSIPVDEGVSSDLRSGRICLTRGLIPA